MSQQCKKQKKGKIYHDFAHNSGDFCILTYFEGYVHGSCGKPGMYDRSLLYNL